MRSEWAKNPYFFIQGNHVWALKTRPPGSQAAINPVTREFRPDVPGAYEFTARTKDEAAKDRPANYKDLPAEEQWQIDKRLGLLD